MQVPVDRGAHIPYTGLAFSFVSQTKNKANGEVWKPFRAPNLACFLWACFATDPSFIRNHRSSDIPFVLRLGSRASGVPKFRRTVFCHNRAGGQYKQQVFIVLLTIVLGRLQCLRAQFLEPVVELLLRDPALPAKLPFSQAAGAALLDHTELVLRPITANSPSWCEVSKNALSVFQALGYCLTFAKNTEGGGLLSAYQLP